MITVRYIGRGTSADPILVWRLIGNFPISYYLLCTKAVHVMNNVLIRGDNDLMEVIGIVPVISSYSYRRRYMVILN